MLCIPNQCICFNSLFSEVALLSVIVSFLDLNSISAEDLFTLNARRAGIFDMLNKDQIVSAK